MKNYRKTLLRLTVPMPLPGSGTPLEGAMCGDGPLKRFLGVAPDFAVFFPTVPVPGGQFFVIRETNEMTYAQ